MTRIRDTNSKRIQDRRTPAQRSEARLQEAGLMPSPPIRVPKSRKQGPPSGPYKPTGPVQKPTKPGIPPGMMPPASGIPRKRAPGVAKKTAKKR